MTNLFPWNKLEYLGEMIQFPSRLEIPVDAFLSIACGIICGYICREKNKCRIIILILIFIWQIISSIICLKSCINALLEYNNVETKQEMQVDSNFIYNICDGVYLPEGAIYEEAKINMFQSKKIQTNNEQLEYFYNKSNLEISIKFKNNDIKSTYIDVPMYYYYGYVAESVNDGNEYKLEKGDRGIIRIFLNDIKEDEIKIYYKITNSQILGISVTTTTILGVMIYFLTKKLTRRLK